LQLKKDHPSWGAPKIREKLRRLHSQITLPAISTAPADHQNSLRSRLGTAIGKLD
jgi:hypothetical protein